jgi:ferredoxin
VDEAQRDERVRNWDTCMFRVYSLEASGHNPRPSRAERTRQRLMHKFNYWLEHADQFGCTGCGRCVRYCPVGLDIRAMIRKAAATPSEVVHAN